LASFFYLKIPITVPDSQDAACGLSHQHATSPDYALLRVLSPDLHDSRA
jgi:hypothetical protein